MPVAKITVIFLIYNDPHYVAGLVDGVLKQRHPNFARQSDWLEVLFMDNGSRDTTADEIRKSLARVGSPAHIKLEVNPENMGISRALNKAFKMARTPYVLTCHCDVLFGSDDYLASMISLLDRHPEAGAITGQPAVMTDKALPFAEKVNLISNLMDIFPASVTQEVVPVGFAESRCDGWRLAALEAAGFYDTALRLAGEDQVLAAGMREKGFEIYQAPHLTYYLSVSSDQDTLSKLVRHTRLFGRAHPYILLRNRNAASGVMGKRAGVNRQARTVLRMLQLVSAFIYFMALIGIVAGAPVAVWLTPLIAVFAAKAYLFRRHVKAVPLTFKETLLFYGFQIPLDVSYSIGLLHGLWLVVRRSSAHPIS